jgi:polysaccharide deacetylase family protein (PEP-CTERM system associated)
MSTSIDNVLTIDVEDYFQVHAFSSVINPADWDNYESRVEGNTYRILEMLSNPDVSNNSYASNRSSGPTKRTENNVQIVQSSTEANSLERSNVSNGSSNSIKATFFILGWIAERYPGLVRDIAAQGHEVASHGYRHELVSNQRPDEFRADVAKTKKILEDITGEEVIGYRASTYSITRKTLWALKILAEEGYGYDSSIFPVHHDVYGFPDAPRFPFKVSLNGDVQTVRSFAAANSFERANDSNGSNNSNVPNDSNLSNGPYVSNISNASNVSNVFWEFPISTVHFFGQNLPVAGGGYFRLFPYWLVKRLLGHINRTEQRPFIFYLHPWEFDPGQPKIDNAPLKSKVRHYLNLDKVEGRFRTLLSDFNFVPIRDLIVSL